jgi:multimeric flavodoxin WrbA
MYILGLNGSPNTGGNTYYILKKLLDICEKKGAKTEIINVPKIINTAKWPFCIVCSDPCDKRCYSETELEKTFDKMKEADGVFIGSPVYFGSVSAQLKAFFDKSRNLRKERAFVNLIGAAISVGGAKYGGQETTIRAIHDMMLVQGMTIIGDGHYDYDAGHHGICSHRPSAEDDFSNKRIEVLANRMIQLTKK